MHCWRLTLLENPQHDLHQMFLLMPLTYWLWFHCQECGAAETSKPQKCNLAKHNARTTPRMDANLAIMPIAVERSTEQHLAKLAMQDL
jgi:hypothetical protein